MRYEFKVKNIKLEQHRIVDRPSRKFRAGDIVVITNTDNRKDIYKIIPSPSTCSGCCLYDVRDDLACIRWKTCHGSHSCILNYRRTHTDGRLVFKDVSSSLEEL